MEKRYISIKVVLPLFTLPSPNFSLELKSIRLLVSTSAPQDLEYPGFEVEDQVWNRLLELRGSKIHKEMELKKQQRLFASMKRKLEALQADCDSVDSQVDHEKLRHDVSCHLPLYDRLRLQHI